MDHPEPIVADIQEHTPDAGTTQPHVYLCWLLGASVLKKTTSFSNGCAKEPAQEDGFRRMLGETLHDLAPLHL